MRLALIAVLIVLIIVLIVKASGGNEKKRKKIVAVIVVISLLSPYLMFWHGSFRKTVFSTKNVSEFYDKILNFYNSNCKNGDDLVFESYSSSGNLIGKISVYEAENSNPLTKRMIFDKSGTQDGKQYLFETIITDRDSKNLYTHDLYTGNIYIYDEMTNVILQVRYSFYGLLYPLSFITAFYPFRSYTYEDIIESRYYVKENKIIETTRNSSLS